MIAEIQNELTKKGSDYHRLMAWLQQPRQGILPQVALPILKEVCQELQEGKEWHLEPLMYSEGLRQAMAKGMLPETYWLEMYILERCRWAQEDILEGQGFPEPFRLQDILNGIDQRMQYLTVLSLRIDAMVAPIKAFLSIPPWMKWIARKIKQGLYNEFWQHLEWR
jgi:hypothetical protein